MQYLLWERAMIFMPEYREMFVQSLKMIKDSKLPFCLSKFCKTVPFNGFDNNLIILIYFINTKSSMLNPSRRH